MHSDVVGLHLSEGFNLQSFRNDTRLSRKCVCTCLCTCIHTCTHTCVCIDKHTCIYTRIHTHKHMYVHTRRRARAYIHVFIYTSIHMHAHTHVCARARAPQGCCSACWGAYFCRHFTAKRGGGHLRCG